MINDTAHTIIFLPQEEGVTRLRVFGDLCYRLIGMIG